LKKKIGLPRFFPCLILALGLSSSLALPQENSADLSGIWDIIPGDNRLNQGAFVEFALKDGRWTGKFTAPSGQEFPLDSVILKDRSVCFSFMAIAGEPESSWTYEAKLTAGLMEGSCNYYGQDSIPFTATKRKDYFDFLISSAAAEAMFRHHSSKKALALAASYPAGSPT